MKCTKRILATVLAFAVALSFALPGMAAVDWNSFLFIRGPLDMTIKHGDSFTLSVEVRIPAGVEDVEYQWLFGRIPIENATTSELHCEPEDSYYPEYNRHGGVSKDYTCQVTAYEKDSAGNIVSTRYIGTTADIRTERTSSGKLYDLTIAPFTYAFGSAVGIISMTYGLLLPVSPIVFLVGLIFGFIQGFKGLF